MKKGIITQTNYIPWKGYFDALQLVDTFVVYDEMQYTRRDWRNRNLIKTTKNSKWLSIPIQKEEYGRSKISDIIVSDVDWNIKHFQQIKENYKIAEFYPQLEEWLEDLYLNCTSRNLSEINLYFIKKINNFLGISVEIVNSADYTLHTDRNQRLIDLCHANQITDYYSGPAAKFYMDISLFENNGINVHFFDYLGYEEYPQLYPPFKHEVSILDLLLNTGKNAVNYMKYFD
jgi:hypothetical protein